MFEFMSSTYFKNWLPLEGNKVTIAIWTGPQDNQIVDEESVSL